MLFQELRLVVEHAGLMKSGIVKVEEQLNSTWVHMIGQQTEHRILAYFPAGKSVKTSLSQC